MVYYTAVKSKPTHVTEWKSADAYEWISGPDFVNIRSQVTGGGNIWCIFDELRSMTVIASPCGPAGVRS